MVIPFESTFTDKPLKNKANQYKVDPTIDGKLDGWKTAFIALLVTKLEQYGTQGPNVPTKVEELTRNLRWRNNYVGRYVEEMLEQSTEEFTSLRVLWRQFTHFTKYSLQINEKQRGTVDSFRQQMISILGEVQKHNNEEGFYCNLKIML
jgi:phage/plasmid-associated DNA primase